MSRGLKTTFELLSATPNEAALDVLVPALESPAAEIQTAAAQALVQRPNLAGHRAVINRAEAFGQPLRNALAGVTSRMRTALREALLGPNRRLAFNASELVLWTRDYDLLPTLIRLIEEPKHPHTDLGRRKILCLAEALYEELSRPRDYRRRRDPQMARRNALGALEASLPKFPRHECRQLLEAYLVLVPRDDARLNSILFDQEHPLRAPVLELLATSPSEGAMRLLASFLDDPHPPRATLRILGSRYDEPFVHLLLGRLGDTPRGTAAENLARVNALPWANPSEGILDRLDGDAQRAAVHVLVASGLHHVATFAALKHLLVHGKPTGRAAAVEALAEHQIPEVNRLIQRAADDPTPRVQAVALKQLRDRGLPGATTLLIERLDSPSPIVREAAREALSDFCFDRFLTSFEVLSDEARRITGRLVKQVDAETLPRLRKELAAPNRLRRARAIEMVIAMDAVGDLKDALRKRLKDDDHGVRIQAAQALATQDSETFSQGAPA